MIGWALRQLAIWGGLALLIFAVGQRLVPHPDATTKSTAALAPGSAPGPPPGSASPTTPPSTPGAVPNSLLFHANSQGHVILDGVVNGAPVRFLVDTGATMVVLTLRDAAAAGFDGNDLNFSMRTSTANGVARAAPVRLRELSVGQLSVDDVPAAVAENLEISLLGQSFLTRLDSYEMRDGVLTLNYW